MIPPDRSARLRSSSFPTPASWRESRPTIRRGMSGRSPWTRSPIHPSLPPLPGAIPTRWSAVLPWPNWIPMRPCSMRPCTMGFRRFVNAQWRVSPRRMRWQPLCGRREMPNCRSSPTNACRIRPPGHPRPPGLNSKPRGRWLTRRFSVNLPNALSPRTYERRPC